MRARLNRISIINRASTELKRCRFRTNAICCINCYNLRFGAIILFLHNSIHFNRYYVISLLRYYDSNYFEITCPWMLYLTPLRMMTTWLFSRTLAALASTLVLSIPVTTSVRSTIRAGMPRRITGLEVSTLK